MKLQERGWLNVNDETAKSAAKGNKSRRGLPVLELFEELLRDGLRQGNGFSAGSGLSGGREACSGGSGEL